MKGDSRTDVWCAVIVHSSPTSQAYRIRITEVREKERERERGQRKWAGHEPVFHT